MACFFPHIFWCKQHKLCLVLAKCFAVHCGLPNFYSGQLLCGLPPLGFHIAQYCSIFYIAQYCSIFHIALYYSIFHITQHFIILKQSAVVRSDLLAGGGSCVTFSSVKGRCQWCPQAATKMMMVTSSPSRKGLCQPIYPQAATKSKMMTVNVCDDHRRSLRSIVHILSVARLGAVDDIRLVVLTIDKVGWVEMRPGGWCACDVLDRSDALPHQ